MVQEVSALAALGRRCGTILSLMAQNCGSVEAGRACCGSCQRVLVYALLVSHSCMI